MQREQADAARRREENKRTKAEQSVAKASSPNSTSCNIHGAPGCQGRLPRPVAKAGCQGLLLGPAPLIRLVVPCTGQSVAKASTLDLDLGSCTIKSPDVDR